VTGAHRITIIEGRAIPLEGDDIDTDRIIPARYLRTVSFDDLEQHVFEDDRSSAAAAPRSTPSASRHPFDDPRFANASVLLVHANFGCGSSREHAPQALYRWGIRAIVGVSFSDIFFGNAGLIGLPCVTAARGDIDALMTNAAEYPERALRVDLVNLTCGSDGMSCRVGMPAGARDAFVSGAWDTTGMLLDRFEDVRAVAARLPYVSGFSATPRG
jgi:3-isopropylmalate/(R)-2-methylmalate dehydratase small subunit